MLLMQLKSMYSAAVGFVLCFLTQSCPALCDPVDCSPPGSSVHGIFPARLLQWVAISSSRGSSQPRDGTLISYVSCIGGKFFTTSVMWEAPSYSLRCTNCHINQMFELINLFSTKNCSNPRISRALCLESYPY